MQPDAKIVHRFEVTIYQDLNTEMYIARADYGGSGVFVQDTTSAKAMTGFIHAMSLLDNEIADAQVARFGTEESEQVMNETVDRYYTAEEEQTFRQIMDAYNDAVSFAERTREDAERDALNDGDISLAERIYEDTRWSAEQDRAEALNQLEAMRRKRIKSE